MKNIKFYSGLPFNVYSNQTDDALLGSGKFKKRLQRGSYSQDLNYFSVQSQLRF